MPGKGLRVAKAQKKDRKVTRTQAKAGAVVSGARGIGSGIIGTLLANQVRASAGKAGLLGVAAGTAFNILLKRSPMGAVVFGGAILARQAFKSGKEAQAKRDARKALEKGALAIPDEATAARLAPTPA